MNQSAHYPPVQIADEILRAIRHYVLTGDARRLFSGPFAGTGIVVRDANGATISMKLDNGQRVAITIADEEQSGEDDGPSDQQIRAW